MRTLFGLALVATTAHAAPPTPRGPAPAAPAPAGPSTRDAIREASTQAGAEHAAIAERIDALAGSIEALRADVASATACPAPTEAPAHDGAPDTATDVAPPTVWVDDALVAELTARLDTLDADLAGLDAAVAAGAPEHLLATSREAARAARDEVAAALDVARAGTPVVAEVPAVELATVQIVEVPGPASPVLPAPAAMGPGFEPIATGPFEVRGFVETFARFEATTSASEINLQQAEIDLARRLGGRATMRLDLQFDRLYGDTPTLTSMIETATVDVTLVESLDLKVGAGRFVAPFGWEGLDPVDKVAISHSMVFNYLDPFLFTGARVSFATGPVDGVAYVAQGYEVLADVNHDKTVGGRLGFRPHEALGFGVSATYGSEVEDDSLDRFQFDVDATFTPHELVLIGGEFELRHEEGASVVTPGDAQRSLGGLVSATVYTPERHAWFTARWDGISDQGGAIWGRRAFAHSFTFAPSVALGGNTRLTFEGRAWWSDQPLFSRSPLPQSGSPMHGISIVKPENQGNHAEYVGMMQLVGAF
jgi:hypothetical protein